MRILEILKIRKRTFQKSVSIMPQLFPSKKIQLLKVNSCCWSTYCKLLEDAL